MSVRDWLDERMLMGVKLGLENCRTLLSRLGDPHLDFPSIHVAGSNGKGSVCVQLSAAASANGLTTGLFTSPHLVTVEERVRIDGRPISPEVFDRLLGSVRDATEMEPECSPTYFETTFLVAMLAFSETGVDRGIIETGMGGRLDATRLVDADMCILTTVSMEHSEFLGDTLIQIASEKAAIHRPGVPLIALEHDDSEVKQVIERTADDDLFWWPSNHIDSTWSSYNSVVEAASAYLGWGAFAGECVWPGRSKGYGEDWVDGVVTRLSAAHNAESLQNDLGEVVRPSVVLLGMSQKADLRATLEPVVAEICMDHVFPKVVFTEPTRGRNPAVSIEELSVMMDNMGVGYIPTEVESDPGKAFEIAGAMARELKCELVVIGSVYLIGDLLEYVVERDGLNLWDELTVH
jgi:dihydrofolate synthase/folylpolyglutamate synthase